jgi:heterodisulfide reductase subunit A
LRSGWGRWSWPRVSTPSTRPVLTPTVCQPAGRGDFALEFERILSATGPYGGHLVRPSSMRGKKATGKPPKRIAWLQCVGSREMNRCDNGYCSSVCCMYAVKQAVMAKDHSETPLECAIFYMDMRTQGKDFDRYCENAARNSGVRFVAARIHTVDSVAGHPTT